MRRGWLGVLAVLVAACGAPPMPTSAGGEEPHPAPNPDRVDPTAAPVPRAYAIPDGAPRIAIDLDHPLHAASPYVNGFNRNHVETQFGVHDMDRAGMMAALRRLQPTWGQPYLDDLARAGYPAKGAARALYRTGHGPTDGRHDYKYLPGYLFQSFWDLAGTPDAWDGYAYDDMRYPLGEAEEIGAEPLVTVNFGSDTADSAGVLARWLNAPDEPLRRTKPFHVNSLAGAATAPRGAFLFEIGNEVALTVVVGHEKANSVEEYVGNAAAYVRAVRDGSPHPVKVALSGPTNVFWGAPNIKGDSWQQQGLMARAFVDSAVREGITFDALQYHGYPAYPVGENLAGNAYAEDLIGRKILPELAKAPWGPVEIWNDEFHAASAAPRNTGMYGALYAADAAVTAFRLSLNGRQAIPVTTDFAVWHAGASNGNDSLYFQDDSPAHATPVYQFRRMLAARFGDWVLPTTVTGVGSWQDTARNGQVTAVSDLHAIAAKAADGTVWVLVVNRSETHEGAWIDVADHRTATRTVIGPTPDAPRPWDASWRQFTLTEDEPVDLGRLVTFPAATITFLKLAP